MLNARILALLCCFLVGCASASKRASIADEEAAKPGRQTKTHHKHSSSDDDSFLDGLLSFSGDDDDYDPSDDDEALVTFDPQKWFSGIRGIFHRDQKRAAVASRRRSAENRSDIESSREIEMAGLTSPADETLGVSQAGQPVGKPAESIAARVNGDVILVQDVITPISGRLREAEKKMPPAEFTKFRRQLIQTQLRDLIERQLLIQEAKRQIPEAGVKRLESLADKEFGKRIESEMRRMKVETEAELRHRMLENGESLEQLKDFQRGTFIAQQFLRMQLAPRLDVSREEMLDYYNLHPDQYKKEGGARWSEILISFKKHGSREAARTKAEQLCYELRHGADFSELAKAQSDGATASQGGRWDLTAQGSYRVAAVDQAIFRLPIGQVSDAIEGPEGWHLVRVDERVAAGESGFVESQEDIRRAIREEKIRQESQRYVQELARKAHITTIFDRPSAN